MLVPPLITFHNLVRDPEVEKRIRDEIANLESYYGQINSIRVVIDVPHRHHGPASTFSVKIDLTVPQGEIVVTQEPSLHPSEKKLHKKFHRKSDEAHPMHHSLVSTINEAFDTARRRLQEYARKQRGDIKVHPGPAHGRISKIFMKKGIGFLKSEIGREIPFRLESVQTGTQSLKPGARVVFTEGEGELGPEAVAVWSVRK
jgi:cold shock CspA family protein